MHHGIFPSLLLIFAMLAACSDGSSTQSSSASATRSAEIATPEKDGQFHDLIRRMAEQPGEKRQILQEDGVVVALGEWSATADTAPKSPDEQWLLGLLYHYGISRDQSPKDANTLLANACNANFAPACFTLSDLAHEAREMQEMEKQLRRAAKGGYLPAMNNLGFLLVTGDGVPARVDEGFQWLIRASELDTSTLGRAAAMGNIGALYLGETKGISEDLEKAISWLSRASSGGDINSTNLLGIAYLRRNATGDAARAREAFEKAADMGSDQAKMNLASLYERGWGVRRDRERADELRKSAGQGEEPFTNQYDFPQGAPR